MNASPVVELAPDLAKSGSSQRAAPTGGRVFLAGPNVSYSTLRTIQPSNGRPTFDEPWIAVTPPMTAFVSTYFSIALPAAAHSALTGSEIDGR